MPNNGITRMLGGFGLTLIMRLNDSNPTHNFFFLAFKKLLYPVKNLFPILRGMVGVFLGGVVILGNG